MDTAEDIEAAPEAEHRASFRTNLLLSATVEVAGAQIPVRIRNLSETGALIEGDGLPDAGVAIVLKRGELHPGATIAWSAGSRRGVRFDGPMAVNAWTGGKGRPLEYTGLRDQRHVDAIQAEIRGGGVSAPGGSEREETEVTKAQLDARLAEELGYVQRLMESLGDQLVGEPIVVQRHSQSLQSIDLASQILGHIASIIVADDRVGAVDRIGMTALRARLKGKSAIS